MGSQKREVVRFDIGEVSNKAVITDEGYLKVDAIVSRAGVFLYQNPDGTIRRELRHPDDVFNSDSLHSLKMRPITNGHPSQKLVNADNYKELAIGYTGESVNVDSPYIKTSLLITDKTGVEDVINGGRQELSLGYTVDVLPEEGVYNGEPYTHRQTNIKYNHLAVVDKARAGHMARIHLDAEDAVAVAPESELSNLNQTKKRNDMNEENSSVITINGVEYQAPLEVISAYNKALEMLEEANAKLNNTTNELQETLADKDQIAAKLDHFESINLDQKIQEAVKLRVNLIASAKDILGSKLTDVNLDEMSNLDLMKFAVKSRYPNVALDSASDVYVQARFDAIVEDGVKTIDATAKQRVLTAPRADAKEETDAEGARERMMEARKNAWKDSKKDKSLEEDRRK